MEILCSPCFTISKRGFRRARVKVTCYYAIPCSQQALTGNQVADNTIFCRNPPSRNFAPFSEQRRQSCVFAVYSSTSHALRVLNGQSSTKTRKPRLLTTCARLKLDIEERGYEHFFLSVKLDSSASLTSTVFDSRLRGIDHCHVICPCYSRMKPGFPSAKSPDANEELLQQAARKRLET